jgi:hypothetical protein
MPFRGVLEHLVLVGAFRQIVPSRRHGNQERPIRGIGHVIGQGQALGRGPTVEFDLTHGTPSMRPNVM